MYLYIYNGSYEEDYDRNKITILYNNMDRNENTINLLLLEDENKQHFVNQYAFGPENKAIKKDMLNIWQQENYKESSVKKLITSFEDKENYGINYRLLKLYIS